MDKRERERALSLPEALPLVEQFDVDSWITWIRNLLFARTCAPRIFVGDDDPDQILIGIFRGLGRADYFQDAVARVLESCAPIDTNSRHIFFLLQSISIIRPPQAKTILQQYLEQEQLVGISFGNVDLDTLALGVRGDYGVDPELIDFINSTTWRSKTLGHSLLCFRLLSKFDADLALLFLERIIPDLSIDQASRSKALTRIMRGFVKRKGYKSLYRWFKARGEYLRGKSSHPFSAFEDLIREQVVPWNKTVFRDPHAALLSATLNAGKQPFSAEEVVEIARLVYQLDSTEDRNEPTAVLEHVWHCSKDKADLWSASRPILGRPRPWFEGGYRDEHDDLYVVQTYWQDNLLSVISDRFKAQNVKILPSSERETLLVIIQATKPLDSRPSLEVKVK